MSEDQNQTPNGADQELRHRVRNVFAVVSALIALSARRYPEASAFADELRGRVAALARAHAFIRPHLDGAQGKAGPSNLHGFLAELLRPYADEGGGRVSITGDDAVFDDQAATAIALLFNELAANAARHGALSRAGGRVRLSTRRRGDRLALTWAEHGGPPLDRGRRRPGFGFALIDLSVDQLDGTLARRWRREGLEATVDVPASALSRRRPAGGTSEDVRGSLSTTGR